MKLHITIPATARRTASRHFFLALAILCLGIYGHAYFERTLYQAESRRQFDLTPNEAITPIASAVRRHPPATALIGRLSVPRLHLSAMVREGVDRDTLQLAIGHIPETALPGQAGNVGVAGHRDTFFRGLKDLRAKDEIQFSTRNGDFKYEVASLMIVEPDDVGVLAPSSDKVLTLVTCYPFSYIGTAPKRFVVRARQVSPESAPPSSVE